MPELPGAGGNDPNPPPLPGTEPFPPVTVPEFWDSPARVIALVFLIASAGTLEAQRDAADLWSTYNELRR